MLTELLVSLIFIADTTLNKFDSLFIEADKSFNEVYYNRIEELKNASVESALLAELRIFGKPFNKHYWEMSNINLKQEQLDARYMRMARIWAENSYCKRRKVGALIVKDKNIISDGYNGTPSGFKNICEEDGVTIPYVLHAEANAITKIAKSHNSSDGATLYVTASPCIECAKLIIQSGIKRVVYDEEYRLTDGIDLLKKAGIEVVHLNP